MKSTNISKFRNASLPVRILILLIAPVIVGFLGTVYAVILAWLFRSGNIIGWILSIGLMGAVVGGVALVTYSFADDHLVFHASDYVGVWAARHKALRRKITVPITIVMGFLVVVHPLTADFLNEIVFKLCYMRVPELVHSLISLWFMALPMVVAVAVEVILFSGKSKALHDKSNNLRARRTAAKQRVWSSV